MNPDRTAAARLCAACGMCCNGVLFHCVQLQPEDNVPLLTSLGLKIKRRHGADQLLQPCLAHTGGHCSIYAERPSRCRIFECKQLRRVAAGETTEEQALATIREAVALAERVRVLFCEAGDDRETKSFATRHDTIFNEPLDLSPEQVEIREHLNAVFGELKTLLQNEFRNQSSHDLHPPADRSAPDKE